MCVYCCCFNSLLSLGSGNRRTAHVRSKGFARVLVLSKRDLHETLVAYPDAQQALMEKANSLLRQDLERQRNSDSRRATLMQRTSKLTVKQDDEIILQQDPDLLSNTAAPNKKGIYPNSDTQHSDFAALSTIQKDISLDQKNIKAYLDSLNVIQKNETACQDNLILDQDSITTNRDSLTTNRDSITTNRRDSLTTTRDSLTAGQSSDIALYRDSHKVNMESGVDSKNGVKLEHRSNSLACSGTELDCDGMEQDSSTAVWGNRIKKVHYGSVERDNSSPELYKSGTELDVKSISGTSTFQDSPIKQNPEKWENARNKDEVEFLHG